MPPEPETQNFSTDTQLPDQNLIRKGKKHWVTRIIVNTGDSQYESLRPAMKMDSFNA